MRTVNLGAIFIIFSMGFIAEASVFGRANPIRLNADGKIEVCWMGVSDATKDLRQSLEATLRAELTEKVGLEFEFFEDCFKHASPYYPVGIAIYDDPGIPDNVYRAILGTVHDRTAAGHPTTYSWGAWNHSGLVDIVMTSQFKDVLPGLEAQAAPLDEAARLNLIKSIFVHEFLHALGFVHEQNHPESTCQGFSQVYSPRHHTAMTAYDPDSLLNYCLTHFYDFSLGSLGLSPLDVDGVMAVYGGL